MLQFIRAPNFLYVYVRRYQQICTLMADSLRELRTAVREWECCCMISSADMIHVYGICPKLLKTLFHILWPKCSFFYAVVS